VRYLDAGAVVSSDGRYRYLLWREWRGTHDPQHWKWLGDVDGAGEPLGEPKACVFIMLNPSTADGAQDDPTIRRCVAFAAAWKFERLEVVNLFAFRATKPEDLMSLGDVDDPVGPENLSHVEEAAREAGMIVCAWGSHGGHLDQAETVIGWLGDRPLWALGVTASGQPRHPLYVRGDAPLLRFTAGDQHHA
jgi:hypothetical protein